VGLRFSDGRPDRLVPILQLPISRLPANFVQVTCKTGLNYTNRLAQVTIVCMGGDGITG